MGSTAWLQILPLTLPSCSAFLFPIRGPTWPSPPRSPAYLPRTSLCSPHSQSSHGGLQALLLLRFVLTVPSSCVPFPQHLHGWCSHLLSAESSPWGGLCNIGPDLSLYLLTPLIFLQSLDHYPTYAMIHFGGNASPSPGRKSPQRKDLAPLSTAVFPGSRSTPGPRQALKQIY